MSTEQQIKGFVDLGYDLCQQYDCDEVDLTPVMRQKLGSQSHLLETVVMEIKRRRYNMPSIYA